MKVSNFEEKKIFSEFVIENSNIPQIYIDEYWDYYINEFNLQDKWNTFLKDISEEGYTFATFNSEFIDVINDCYNILYPQFGEEQKKKGIEILETITPQITECPYINVPDGTYLNVDIHNAAGLTLKMIGVFNDEYPSFQSIIEKTKHNSFFGKYKIFRNYVLNYLDNDLLYSMYSDVLVERLYQSDNETIKYLNDNFELVCKTGGDNFLYKLPENKTIDGVVGEHTQDNIPFHIEQLTVKHLTLFGSEYIIFIQYDKQNKIDTVRLYDCKGVPVSLSLYPFALKLALGEELNDKDLAIGYEDQVFFNFNISEII